MARYASGKKAYGYSDRSGFRYRLREMRKEWNGLKVGPDEYEPKHPQLEPNYPGPDPTALYEPRPDSRSEVSVENLLGLNPFKVLSLDVGGTTVTIQVTEKNHGRSTSDTIRFRNCSGNGVGLVSKALIESVSGYSISLVTTDQYTISVTIASTIADSSTLNIVGGGDRATAGPVTLEK